uniref:Uncharacterized protein n=1 Tax=Picea glauca TaxID=3330 RepID=A0A101LX75_PICGL|nr:hypothetical protein ABT39_MTgene6025 [Picea glauca]QHR86823.1 hypothetical protein Q903MT_gene830 [Picea sitchensis]
MGIQLTLLHRRKLLLQRLDQLLVLGKLYMLLMLLLLLVLLPLFMDML